MSSQVPEDMMRRWFYANQDLRTAVGRLAFYAPFDRGATLEEGEGTPRSCTVLFHRALLNDLDAVANAIQNPGRMPHTSVVDCLFAGQLEIERVLNHPELEPMPNARVVFMSLAGPKIQGIMDLLESRSQYWDSIDYWLNSRVNADAQQARPTYERGNAPWSQFLAPGAPALRDTDNLHPIADRNVQVLTPVARSIVDHHTRVFRETEEAIGVADQFDDAEDPGWNFDEENFEVDLGSGFCSEQDIQYEHEDAYRAMPLSQVNHLMERMARIPGGQELDPTSYRDFIQMMDANQEVGPGDVAPMTKLHPRERQE